MNDVFLEALGSLCNHVAWENFSLLFHQPTETLIVLCGYVVSSQSLTIFSRGSDPEPTSGRGLQCSQAP